MSTFDSTHFRARVHRPAVWFPEHVMSLDDMKAMARKHYGGTPHFDRIVAMIENTMIDERRFIMPHESLGEQGGLAERTERYLSRARWMARKVSLEALAHAELEPSDIDLVIAVSCTSFVMPSLDAYLINEIGLRSNVKRMPIAQLGCSAGASALIKAMDHCRAYRDARVLVVAVELSSICFFPEFDDLTSAVCASIFGDGAGACIVTGPDVPVGRDDVRLSLHSNMTHTVPDSEHYIRYLVTDRGYHLTLDKGVMHSMPVVAPLLDGFLQEEGTRAEALDFIVAHTGGRRILDGLIENLGAAHDLVDHSRASLREYGNTASVSVLDVITRGWDTDRLRLAHTENHGLVVAFGPGFTMDAISASWN